MPELHTTNIKLIGEPFAARWGFQGRLPDNVKLDVARDRNGMTMQRDHPLGQEQDDYNGETDYRGRGENVESRMRVSFLDKHLKLSPSPARFKPAIEIIINNPGKIKRPSPYNHMTKYNFQYWPPVRSLSNCNPS